MLKFKDGLLLGTTMSAAGNPADPAAGGGGNPAAPANSNFLSALPEPLRADPAFKDVKDVADLATRYHKDRNAPLTERLPEAIRAEPYFKDIKSVDDLAVKAFNQAKMIGRDPNSLVALPADQKDEKAWGEVWNKLGRPESADKYEIPLNRADGKAYTAEDTAFQKTIVPILHEAGITQGQLAKILPKWDGMQDQMRQAVESARAKEFKEASDGLRGELGAAYDGHLDLADSAIKHFDATLKLNGALAKDLDRSNLANNPALFKIFAKIGESLKEDGLIGKAQGGHDGALTPDQAKAEIRTLEAHPGFNDKNHAEHANVIAKRKELYGMAYPET